MGEKNSKKVRPKIPCLDHGFVELITLTPDPDLLVVNAARCSFDKEHEKYDTTTDSKLINFLAKAGHWLPFRHPHITFRLSLPIFVARQAFKHQVGMSLSEVSRRYIKDEVKFYDPGDIFKGSQGWRLKAENVKQGSSSENHPWGPEYENYNYDDRDLDYDDLIVFSEKLYEDALGKGIAPEVARVTLLQSMYTTCVWTGSLLSWHHFVGSRLEKTAQKEIQIYADAVSEIMVTLAPHSWNALRATGSLVELCNKVKELKKELDEYKERQYDEI